MATSYKYVTELIFEDSRTGHQHTIRMVTADVEKSREEILALMQQISDQHLVYNRDEDYYEVPVGMQLVYTETRSVW